jgi:hypothetical protein
MKKALLIILIVVLCGTRNDTKGQQIISNAQSYLCDATSGYGLIYFYTSNYYGVGCSFWVYVNNVQVFSGSGGSNFSWQNYTYLNQGDQVMIVVSGYSYVSKVFSVEVKYSPSQPTITASATSICLPATATLSNTSTPGATTYWNLNGSFYTSSTSFTTSTGGVYSVYETNSCGTSPTSTVTLTVKSNRLQGSGAISLSDVNKALGRPLANPSTVFSNQVASADGQVPKSTPYRLSSFYNYCY